MTADVFYGLIIFHPWFMVVVVLLPRDRGVEELYGEPRSGPEFKNTHALSFSTLFVA